MAKLAEILEMESKRDGEEGFRVVRLFAEGNFYRAYEWSAFLACRYINPFNASRRADKDGGSHVMIGFPLGSLSKFTPDGATVVENEDNSVDMSLPVSLLPEGLDVEAMKKEFENWKGSVPLKESEKKPSLAAELRAAGSPEASSPSPMRMMDVMRLVLSFPVERKSPMECMAFLAEIKQHLAKIL